MITRETIVIPFPPHDKSKESFHIFSSIIYWVLISASKELSVKIINLLRFVISAGRKDFPKYKKN